MRRADMRGSHPAVEPIDGMQSLWAVWPISDRCTLDSNSWLT
jgi:hypothetical protein